MSTSLAVRPRQDLATLTKELDHTVRLARIFSESRMFADSTEIAQAVVKIEAGREMGLTAFQSMTGIVIVKGRMSLSANLIGTQIKRSGKYKYKIIEHTYTACELEFFEWDEKAKSWESQGNSRFTTDDAKKAGLSGVNWTNYVRNMLFARTLSNGARWFCPDVFGGAPVYTPDELGAEVDGMTGEMVKMPSSREVASVNLEEVVEGEVVQQKEVSRNIPVLIAAFASIKVSENQLVAKYGNLENLGADKVTELRSVYDAIKGGKPFSDFFPADLDSIKPADATNIERGGSSEAAPKPKKKAA